MLLGRVDAPQQKALHLIWPWVVVGEAFEHLDIAILDQDHEAGAVLYALDLGLNITKPDAARVQDRRCGCVGYDVREETDTRKLSLYDTAVP